MQVADTAAELRNRDHQFGARLLEMCKVCDVLCSAPAAAIITGERASLFGSPMLVAPLPFRIYVGCLGRIESPSDECRPRILSFAYWDPCDKRLVQEADNGDFAFPFGIGDVLLEVVKHWHKPAHVNYLPTELHILSEFPPGRGVNWSGALSAAIALLIDKLHGNDTPDELTSSFWTRRARGHGLSFSDDFQRVFAPALEIEKAAQGVASGFGPAVSLLPPRKQPVVFKAHMTEGETPGATPSHTGRFFYRHWRDLAVKTSDEDPGHWNPERLDLMLIDPKHPRQTADVLANHMSKEEAGMVHELLEAIIADQPRSRRRQVRKPVIIDTIIESKLTSTVAISAISIFLIHELRKCFGPQGEGSEAIRILQSLDQLHRRLNLSFPKLEEIRMLLAAEIGSHQIAVKFTGGGLGGHILLAGSSNAVDTTREKLLGSDCPGVILWRLSTDGIDDCGTRQESARFSEHGIIQRKLSPPFHRQPTDHIARYFSSDGSVRSLTDGPNSLYALRKEFLSIAAGPQCTVYWDHGNRAVARNEPLWYTVPDSRALSGIRWFAHHSGKAWPLLRYILSRLHQANSNTIEIPYQATGSDNFEDARDTFNSAAITNFTGDRRKTPRLHLDARRAVNGVRLTLEVPQGAAFFTVGPV